MDNLSARSLSAVFWGGGGALIRLLLQFGSQVVLARLLGPEQYGIFAIGAIVIGFSNFFSDVGLAYGLIQKKNVTAEDVRFVFTWQILLGLLVTLCVYWAAEDIAVFFGDARAAAVVQALALVCLINALTAPSLNLLKRELNFKQLQLAQISGFMLGYVVIGIPLAFAGAEVWALVCAWLVQALCILLLNYRASRHGLRPLLHYAGARSLGIYGGTVFITNLINWVIGNIDRVIIGRVFPSREIGLYATSYNMLQTPTASILGIVQPVFFAASARISEDQAAIARNYRALVAAVTTYLLPAFAALAVVSETFVLALYGRQWQAAAALFTPFALAMPFFLLWGLTTPLLWTGGHINKEFQIQLPLAMLWLLATALAAWHSVMLVAWVVLGLYLVRYGVMVFAIRRFLDWPLQPLWLAVRGGLLCAVMVATLVKMLDLYLTRQAVSPLLRLFIDAWTGGLSLLGLLKLLPGLMSHELLGLNQRLVARCPKKLAQRLDFLCGRMRHEHG